MQSLNMLLTNAICTAGLREHLRSLADTGKALKMCNVCFQRKPIDSHIISKGVLEKACKDGKHRTIMLVDSQRPLTNTTPTTCVVKLECEKCDGSTSSEERAFIERFDTYTKLESQDALLFLVYGYRFLNVRNILKYAVRDELANYEEDLEPFLIEVWNIRNSLLKCKEQVDREQVYRAATSRAATNRVLFQVLTESETDQCSYRFALVLCSVDLTAIDPDLKCCPLIYTRARHCCWVVLLGKHRAPDLQEHFPRMIYGIENHLSRVKIEPEGIVMKDRLKIKL